MGDPLISYTEGIANSVTEVAAAGSNTEKTEW